MNWLIAKIVGNPTVLILLLLSAFVFGVSSGGSVAWWIQGMRITESKQAHTKYVQDLMQQAHQYREQADRLRERAATEYAQLQEKLNEEIDTHAVFRRCVAAGKCGVRKPVACPQAGRIPPVGGNNDSRADAVPVAGVDAAQVVASSDEQGDPVINECAITTLRLNRLQAEIAAQPGYLDSAP